MKHESIVCDGCDVEIKMSKGMDSWYLNLSAIEHGDYSGGVVYCVSKIAPIDRSMQFCDKKCLSIWLKDKA